MSTESIIEKEDAEVLPSILQVGINKYSTDAIEASRSLIGNYCHGILAGMKIIPPTKDVTDKLHICKLEPYPVACTSFKNTSQFVISSLIKKLRREVPFAGPTTIGMHKGRSNASSAILFMILQDDDAVKRYLRKWIAYSDARNLPFKVEMQSFQAKNSASDALKKLCEDSGLSDEDTCLGVTLNLSEVNRYLEHYYAINSATYKDAKGETRHLVFTDENPDATPSVVSGEDLAAPHIFMYMPHIYNILATLVRKHLCFQNSSL